MELKEVQNNHRKDKVMVIRTTKEISEWMKKYKISPTLVFHKAIEELKGKMEEEKKSKKESL